MRALVSVISVTEILETEGPTGAVGVVSAEGAVSVVGEDVVSAGRIWATANDACEHIIARARREIKNGLDFLTKMLAESVARYAATMRTHRRAMRPHRADTFFFGRRVNHPNRA